MPLLPEQTDNTLPDLVREPIVDDNNEIVPEMTKAFGASFRLDNTVGALLANKARGNGVFDENFDWGKSFRELPIGYQLDYGNNFALAENQDHFDAIKQQIDQEQEDRNYLASSGWLGVAAGISMGGFLEPLNLIPIGGMAVKVGKGAKSVLEGSAKIAMTGAAATTVQELALHSQQETRTFGESAANVSISTLLSGVLGAAMYKNLAKDAHYDKLIANLEKEFKLDADNINGEFGWSGGPIATKAQKETPTNALSQEGLASAKGLEKVFRFQDPGLRLIQSESKASRVGVQNLAEISGKLNKNFEGIRTPTPVESLKKIDEGRLANSIQYGREQYVEYRKRLGANDVKDRLTYSEFMEAVGKAGRRNDVSDIPEVAKVASQRRQNIYNYFRDEAKKIKGMLEDDDLVNTALSYINRIYNREKVVQNSEDFLNRTMRYLKNDAVFASAPGSKKYNRLEDALDFGDDSEFMNAAQDIKRNIIGARSNIIHDRLGMSVQPKFTKSRKFLIKDEEIEDFLESDSDLLITQYVRNMSSRIRLAQKFGMEFIDDDFSTAKSQIVKDVRADYAKLQREFKADPKKLDALHKAEESDVNDILAVRDRLMGTYGYTSNPDSWLYRFQKQVKQFNVLRLLGDLTTSAIPDLGKLVYVSGFTKMFSQGVVPLVAKLRSPEMRAYLKQNAQEIRNMGTTLDLLTQSTANSINDIVDDFGRHTKAERALNYLGGKFQKVTGIGYWNSKLKTVVATMVQTNMAEAMTKVLAGTATKREIADLAASGIDKEFAKIIKQQIAKHGETVEGVIMPNIAAWDEGTLNAAEAYAGAVAKAADSIIVTPGVSTTPLWMSRQGLNLMGQFKSFAFSSVQKTMIPMMQDFDSKTAQALVAMGALGTLTAIIKRTASGQELPDTNTLIMEGVDRSGVLGWTMDANNMLEKITNGNLGISKIAGSQPMSRYAQRGRVESVLGPSAALLSDAMVISGDLAGGDVRKSTTHRIRKMIPFQTLMGVRQTLDLLEEEVNSSMGITKR